jgi:hypothetical protein
MNRQSHNFLFWGCLSLLLVGSLAGLTNRYVTGKPIAPWNGLAVGVGGVVLMFFNARLEAMEDLE